MKFIHIADKFLLGFRIASLLLLNNKERTAPSPALQGGELSPEPCEGD